MSLFQPLLSAQKPSNRAKTQCNEEVRYKDDVYLTGRKIWGWEHTQGKTGRAKSRLAFCPCSEGQGGEFSRPPSYKERNFHQRALQILVEKCVYHIDIRLVEGRTLKWNGTNASSNPAGRGFQDWPAQRALAFSLHHLQG